MSKEDPSLKITIRRIGEGLTPQWQTPLRRMWRERLKDESMVSGQWGHSNSWRRLDNGRRGHRTSPGEQGKPPSDNGWGNFIDWTDDGGRVCRLKLVNIQAFVDNNRVAMIQRECQDSPERTLGINGSRIVEEAIPVVDVAGDRGELDNPWSCFWGCEGHSQRVGRLRFHDAYRDVQVTAIQMMIARTETE
jgi:hypothetical protein